MNDRTPMNRPTPRTPLSRLTHYLGLSRQAMVTANVIAGQASDEAAADLEVHAEMIARVQDLIREARTVESVLTMAMGKAVREAKAERLGNLEDGRQWRLHRTSDRKAWDHDRWKRDARKAAADATLADLQLPRVVNIVTDDGEVVPQDLAAPLYDVMARVQEFHGSAAPKVGTLKRHNLDPQDYCEQVPGNWKLDVIAPSDNHDQDED